MTADLFDFDDWGTFLLRGLLVVGAVALTVFVVVTLAFWVHGLVAQPVFSRTTAVVVAQPQTSLEWLGHALVLGAVCAVGAVVLGLFVLGLGAVLAVFGQGMEARQVSNLSIAEISAQARRAAEAGIRGGPDAS